MHFYADIEQDSHFSAVLDMVAHLDAFTDAVVREAVNTDIAPAILSEAQVEPGAVAKPIQWTSARQRRYVMAKIRSGEIASPYVRTHAVSQGYAFIVTTAEGDYTRIAFVNNASAFTFVSGMTQQRFHANTGWLNAPAKADAWIAATLSGLSAAFERQWAKGGSS